MAEQQRGVTNGKKKPQKKVVCKTEIVIDSEEWKPKRRFHCGYGNGSDGGGDSVEEMVRVKVVDMMVEVMVKVVRWR